MNANTLVARLLTASMLTIASSAVMAQEIIVVPDTFKPMKSRAEVRAEVIAARTAGQLPRYDESASAMGQFPATPSTTSRDAVRAELRNAPRTPVMIYNPAA